MASTKLPKRYVIESHRLHVQLRLKRHNQSTLVSLVNP